MTAGCRTATVSQKLGMLSLTVVMPVILTVFACKPSGSSVIKGYVSEGDQYIWPSKHIEVCWENPTSANAHGRQLVQQIVQQEYGRAGFTFSGWSQCQSSSQGIRIREADNRDIRVEAFGRRLIGIPNGMKLNLQWKAVDICRGVEDLCSKQDGLHEFGHALGLRHEMNRPDNNCSLDQMKHQGEVGAVTTFAYDERSIMNYCANMAERSAGIQPRLSDGDIQTLNFYYDQKGRGPSQVQCEADANSWRVESMYSCCVHREGNKRRDASERQFQYCDEHEKTLEKGGSSSGGTCPDGDNGPGQGYGQKYQCGSNQCAKSDTSYANECIIGSGGSSGGSSSSGGSGGSSGGGTCPDGDNGPGQGYGQKYQCGSSQCAKTDKTYSTQCTIGSGSSSSGSSGGYTGGSSGSGGTCPDGDNGPGQGYGQKYQCGSSQCAKTDKTYSTQCVIGGGSSSGGSSTGSSGSGGTCPDGDNGPGQGYGQKYQCGSNQCAKTDKTYSTQCVIN